MKPGRRRRRATHAAGSDQAQARELERLRQENERFRQQVDQQAKQIAEAAKQIQDLERQLALRNQNSTITSKPPASDGLAGRPRVRGRRRKSRRKPGGQPGDPGHSRPLVPAERVDAIVDLVPDACPQCQRRLQTRDDVGETPKLIWNDPVKSAC